MQRNLKCSSTTLSMVVVYDYYYDDYEDPCELHNFQ
jgi:hypothetical protein